MVNITLKARLNGSICSSSPDFEMMDHTKLRNRDVENQHPISSISGLSERLNEIDDKLESASEEDKRLDKYITDESERLEEMIKKVDSKLVIVDKLPEIDLSTDMDKLYKCGNGLYIVAERIIT